MTSTITLITGEGSVRVYGDNLVLDMRNEFQAKASEDNGATGEATMRPADSMTGEVSRVDAGRTASATSERMDVTAGETATELCFPNGSASADERSNPSLISGGGDLVEAGTGQTRAVLPQEPSKADDGRNVEASGGAASVITNSETPAGPLPTPRQADGAGEAVPPTSPAPLSTGATVATGSAGGPDSAPVKVSMKKMRPYCQHPGSDKCGGYSHKHCYSCTKLMREREREEVA